ncbi:hypothetical protein GG344DRAFT_77642 [Lentinula edodes]|nr:hypothetical protein GG344DRAFT_77642 [Lentinula edodes]
MSSHHPVQAATTSLGVLLGLVIGRTVGINSNSRSQFPVPDNRLKIQPSDLLEVVEKEKRPNEPVVDIIAVHGLGSTYPSSWTEKESGVNFLRAFLPEDFPQARVLAFVYPSQPFSDPVHVDLKELGIRLLRALVDDRQGSSIKKKRAIIFIGHSFGGLVIKQALVQAGSYNSGVQGMQNDIIEATRGIIFLGTPHFGSRYATLGLIRAWVSHIVGGAHTTLLYTLLEQSLELRRLNENFLAFPAIHKIRDNIICFFELKGEVGAFGRVVDEEYACIDSFQRISCNSTHKGLNKFSERNGEYRDIYRSIQRAYASILARSKLDNYANSEYAFFCKITGEGFLVFDHDEACVRQTDTEWIIYQRGSGHSCTLLFQYEKTQTKIAVTMGVHNYAPWVFVSTDVETETAVQITASFYDDKGKRPYTHNHWNQVRTSLGKVPFSNVSATANITDMEDMEKRYQATIELSGFDS